MPFLIKLLGLDSALRQSHPICFSSKNCRISYAVQIGCLIKEAISTIALSLCLLTRWRYGIEMHELAAFGLRQSSH